MRRRLPVSGGACPALSLKFSATQTSPLTFALAILLVAASVTEAQDVVRLLNPHTGKTYSVSGKIVDYSGTVIVVRSVSGSEKMFDPSLVQSFETKWAPAHQAARELMRVGKYEEALAKLQEAVAVESSPDRRWVQRVILSEIVSCLTALGKTESAGNMFLKLVKLDSQTPWFGCIPLAWRTREPSLTLSRQAETWLAERETAASRLLGASWLLPTRHRGSAIAELRKLSVDADRRIAQLAAAQLWRTELMSAEPADVERWQRMLESMPGDLTAGPYFVLGQALSRLGQHEASALALMRPPILLPERRDLAAAGLIEAAGQLSRLGRNRQAVRLYREVITEHPGPAADEAKQLLESMVIEE
jgi:tetratricopeptide (TPR) repeat protein